MATDKINNYSIGDNNFESVMLTLDQTFRNKHDCYSFSATALKAGSVIEINGSLYPVTQDVTLPDMTSNKYLMAVPTSAGTFTLLATSTAPTWSDAKQGFYGTSTTANYKYIAVKEGSVIYKYNDRPFYVGAIYADALNMSGDINCGDIICDDITCDVITANDVNCYTSESRTYAPRTATVINIKCPTTVRVVTDKLDSNMKIEMLMNGKYAFILGGDPDSEPRALNPGTYRVHAGYGDGYYVFSGAGLTETIGNIF